jgi:hypothetical protein
MGLLMRRRRPVMRMAGAAALGTAAYQAGTRHDQEAPSTERSQQAFAATQGPTAGPITVRDTSAELERLAQLHDSGALTDAEFCAAKSQLLGI